MVSRPFSIKCVTAALLAAAAGSLGGCATMPTGAVSAMRDGGTTMPPQGWLDYCTRNEKDPSCQAVQLDQTRWNQLEQVQQSLRSIRRVSDQRAMGRAEYWQVAETSGDCEDIALAARARLAAQGWPISSLRLATAWTEQREYHLVLTVDAALDGQPATYVLDSRFSTVMRWDRLQKMGYRFQTRQAARGPTWVRVEA